MRILHVVPYYRPAFRYGGPIFSVHGLCRSLVARGNEVEVYTTDADGPGRLIELDGPTETIDGVKVTYFPRAGYGSRIFYAPAMAAALKQNVATFDLLHTHTAFLYPTAAAANIFRRQRIPYVISPRGMLVKKLISSKSVIAKEIWIKMIERKNIERATAVHVTADVEEIELRAFNWNLPPVVKIINGVDDPASTGEPSRDVLHACRNPSTVLFLGRISWKKGLGVLLHAIAKTRLGHLIIAGPDDEYLTPTLIKLAADLKIEERVTILPRTISGVDKEYMFRSASLFVLTSINENFGNTVLEAMRRGIPVLIGTEIGAAEVVRSSGGGVVVNASADEISSHIDRLLSDPKLLRDMGTNGSEYAMRECSWSAVAERMEALYRESVKQNLGR